MLCSNYKLIRDPLGCALPNHGAPSFDGGLLTEDGLGFEV